MTPRPRLVHTIDLRCDPATAWAAITDPAYTQHYLFGLRPKGAFRPGARVVYERQDGAPYMTADVIAVEEPTLLRYSVRVLRDADTAADLPSRVTWEIEPTATGCRLTVVHDEFEAETATYRRLQGGWPMALAGLAELIQTGSARATQESWPDHLERPVGPEPRAFE